MHCTQIPVDTREVPSLFKALNLCLRCSYPIKAGEQHDPKCMPKHREKYLCQTHNWNRAFFCGNKALTKVKSNYCKVVRKANSDDLDEIIGGDSLLGIEMLESNNGSHP